MASHRVSALRAMLVINLVVFSTSQLTPGDQGGRDLLDEERNTVPSTAVYRVSKRPRGVTDLSNVTGNEQSDEELNFDCKTPCSAQAKTNPNLLEWQDGYCNCAKGWFGQQCELYIHHDSFDLDNVTYYVYGKCQQPEMFEDAYPSKEACARAVWNNLSHAAVVYNSQTGSCGGCETTDSIMETERWDEHEETFLLPVADTFCLQPYNFDGDALKKLGKFDNAYLDKLAYLEILQPKAEEIERYFGRKQLPTYVYPRVWKCKKQNDNETMLIDGMQFIPAKFTRTEYPYYQWTWDPRENYVECGDENGEIHMEDEDGDPNLIPFLLIGLGAFIGLASTLWGIYLFCWSNSPLPGMGHFERSKGKIDSTSSRGGLMSSSNNHQSCFNQCVRLCCCNHSLCTDSSRAANSFEDDGAVRYANNDNDEGTHLVTYLY